MDWRLKSLAFQIFDNVPFGGLVHYLSQRYITKRLPRKIQPVSESSSVFRQHINVFKEYANSLDNALYFEFGAGYDLFSNILMYCYGIDRQISIDIKPLAKATLVNLVINHLSQETLPEVVRFPKAIVRSETFLEDLKKFYGIEYRGNADASCMELPDESVDLIATTSTLEHIPHETLKNIMQECYRLCHKNSVISMQIDYTDHYAHSDPNINVYNFLSFSEEEWTKFNPGIHYQNRLRHSEYKKIFLKAGFEIVRESYEIPELGLEQISNLKLDSHFQNYSIDDLAKTSGHFVLKK